MLAGVYWLYSRFSPRVSSTPFCRGGFDFKLAPPFKKESFMKGKAEVLQVLQEALTDELGAVHEYILHAEMCESWGYKTLGGATTKRAIEEMKHAEKLMSRILYLEGEPDVQSLPKLVIGKDVEAQLVDGLKGEQAAMAKYNQAVAVCVKAGDNGSADLLRGNLLDEERHADYLETQLSLVKQLGLANYLAQNLAE
jgi:bacterioferritin